MEGPLPSSIGALPNLRHLNVAKNSIRHTVPAELGNLENLELLDLHGNMGEGPLPDSLVHLRKLRYFHIFGSIPSQSTSAPLQFNAERYRHLCQLHVMTGIDAFSCGASDIYGHAPSIEERDAEKALVRRSLSRFESRNVR